MHFYWSYLTANIMSTVLLPGLKPHCASGRVCLETVMSLLRMARTKIFPATERGKCPCSSSSSPYFPFSYRGRRSGRRGNRLASSSTPRQWAGHHGRPQGRRDPLPCSSQQGCHLFPMLCQGLSDDNSGALPEAEGPKTVFSELKDFLELWVPA